jgi:uncharacterized repeat protein (TIGR03803 family)
MSHSRILDALKTNRNGSRRLALACALLMALFTIPLHAQSYQDLYDFKCSIGGCFPYNFGYLTQGLNGDLYGTTTQTGTFLTGGVFELSTSGTISNFYDFDGLDDGAFPNSGLTLASDRNFYGTTASAGAFGNGTLFRLTPGGTLTVLHAFSSAEGAPQTAPVEVNNGTIDNLYGVTGSGTTYQITLAKGTYKQLPNKAPGPTFGQLLPAPDGYLYGVTQTGGTNNLGTVFRMTTAGGIKIIHSFNGSDGSAPDGPLTWNLSEKTWDGILYGTTDAGGANNTGAIFKVTTSGTLNVLRSFDPYVGGFTCNNDGGNPAAGLTFVSSGLFYGVNSLGGANCDGTIFQITAAGSFTKIFDFDETGNTNIWGWDPYTTLVKHTNGCFYGLTSMGGNTPGQNPMGNAYSLCPVNLLQISRVAGPIFVLPGVPVQFLGNDLSQTAEVTFAGESAQFQVQSDTYLTADVPNDAVDGAVDLILQTGFQLQTQSAIRILPLITNLDPTSGPVGTQVVITGGGFTGAKKVTFGGVKATSFTVQDPTHILATVPSGAKTGKVGCTAPNGAAKSKQTFTVN